MLLRDSIVASVARIRARDIPAEALTGAGRTTTVRACPRCPSSARLVASSSPPRGTAWPDDTPRSAPRHPPPSARSRGRFHVRSHRPAEPPAAARSLLMDLSFLVRGFLIGFGVALGVGPISLLVIRRTLDHGRVYGLASGAGVALADASYGAVAAFGLTAVTAVLVSARAPLALVGG